jgi:hypothetical protein
MQSLGAKEDAVPRSTMSLDEVSARLEIQALLTRYAIAIDTHDWELLDTVFTADAWIDYESSGGIKGPYPEVRRWLGEVLPLLPRKQHLIAAPHLALDGDRARARTYVHNPNAFPQADGPSVHMIVDAYYDDDLVWTDAGWRIAKRVEVEVIRRDGR